MNTLNDVQALFVVVVRTKALIPNEMVVADPAEYTVWLGRTLYRELKRKDMLAPMGVRHVEYSDTADTSTITFDVRLKKTATVNALREVARFVAHGALRFEWRLW